MSDIRENINLRIKTILDQVEKKMKLQEHITNSEPVLELLSQVESLWNYLDEDDREFIGAVRFVVRSKMRWD